MLYSLKRWLFAFITLLISQPSIGLELPPLPEGVSNNAVALVETEQGPFIISMMGLGPAKTHQAVHNKVWSVQPGDNEWQQMSAVPSSLPLSGRLAAIAVAVDDKVFLFGGYTVASDHSEVSSSDNFMYTVISDTYTPIAAMPVAVDDAVALVYADRYIYVISGWHNDGNVNLAQVYDIKKDRWFQASPFVGRPVFGHAGGIVGRNLVICDGVAVVADATKRRGFESVAACYFGTIDEHNPAKINWHTLAHPTQTARYRMAATGVKETNQIVFLGGATNPYNYNGIGYNGQPSQPTSEMWVFDLHKGAWQVSQVLPATMDHRGLLYLDNMLIRVGGMDADQTVSAQVRTNRLE